MTKLPKLLASVRRALFARAVLRDSLAGAVVAGAAALVLALAVPGIPRLPLLALLAAGPLVGLVRGLRARPSDADLVLYVDRRLDADQAIVTAWELGDDWTFAEDTRARAEAKLAPATAKDVRPRILRSEAWGLPLAAAFFAAALLVPAPAAPGTGLGRDTVQLENPEVLRRIERLSEMARDPEQRRALEEAAREARELRKALEEGVERRDALDRIAELRERVDEARRRETPEQRRARDAAAEALEPEPGMQRALAERDLESLDREVERAAARREAADRDRARQALTEAAEAARREGDGELAESLLRRERLLRRRSEQAELARELAEAMPELVDSRLGRTLERLERDGAGAELTREMVEAMREAWSRLTPEERRRLAEAMQRAQALENDQARDDAEANAQPMTADEMEQQLRDALANLDQLQGQCTGGAGALPIAQNRPGNGNGNGNGNGSGAGGPGGPDDTGTGPEGGRTQDLADATDGPLARVRPVLGPGAPSRSTVTWTNPDGTPIEGATAGDPTATGAPAAGEPGAIERAPIPEDYRDHVRIYFGGDE